MKKLLIVLSSLAALAVAGWGVLRGRHRAPESAKPVAPAAPTDGFQSGVKLDSRTGGEPDAAARRRVMDRLRREEIRQRPAEGRN
jgi:hypothetical protein